MPFPPETFCDVAQTIAEGNRVPCGEARHRTVVGRAYYGAFWATCIAVCRTHGINPPQHLPHDTLCETLAGFTSDIEVCDLGTLLNGLRGLRVTADYRPRRVVSEEDADDAIEDARRIMEILRGVEGRLPRVDPREQY